MIAAHWRNAASSIGEDKADVFYEPSQPHGLKRDPFKALVVPRPIGWISTVSATGVANLSPFSFFNAISASPPMVAFAANGRHAEGGPKDTLQNVTDTGEFVVNLATWDLREAVNRSSVAAPRAVDEFDLVGLEKLPSHLVRPPRVAASPVHLECRLLQIVPLPADPVTGEPNTLTIGSVVGVHIADAVLRDGRVDTAALAPIARLGYMDYAVVRDTFAMQRPTWPFIAEETPK